MAEVDPRNLEDAIVQAFAGSINVTAPGLRRALTAAFEFAAVETLRRPFRRRGEFGWDVEIVETGHEIVIDQAALFTGIFTDGLRSPDSRSSSAWLATWLKSQEILVEGGPAIPGRDTERPALTFAGGAPLVASRSLRGVVLPRACDLARKTVGRDVADLRHVLFALLEEPRGSLGPVGALLTGDRPDKLRAWLVDRIGTAPEPGESMEAWQDALKGPAPIETVRTLSDAPAIVDSLGRRAFAEVLGARIREVGATLRGSGSRSDSAFILHMDGPWGSGKSSILNFLKRDLERTRPSWLVVEFNAWRNQHRKPAWLPLIQEVRSAAARRVTPWSPAVWLVCLWWRLRMDWLSYVIALLFISIAGFLVWSSTPEAAAEGVRTGSLGVAKTAEETLKTLGAIVATAVGFLAMARGFTHGSQRNAEVYIESKSEPFRRVIRFFRWLVLATRRPVAVFIDDLDRCDSGYVIDLLEGVQTSLRSAPVVYVVAGDRKWISSSFEKRYADFGGEVGTPGRPLGHLFLDKVFQLSTSVPQLSDRHRQDYWRLLLQREDAIATANEQSAAASEAKLELAGKTRHEDIQRAVANAPEGSLKREALQAEAAKQITSPAAMRAAEHRLEPLFDLLEPNPRSMKRLVNAYGLNHARAFLEGREVAVEALARWTIMELRWPVLAEYLARNWPDIADGILPPANFPEQIRELLVDADIRAVIGSVEEEGHLNVAALKTILD